MSGLQFGTGLPDKVDKISNISDAQLDLLRDLRELFRERGALEKEHSTKLQALAKKAGEKKSKHISRLVLGDDPTQAWSEDTVKLSTFDNAYTKLLSSLENESQDHMILADSLTSQVAEELKKLERKSEETKKLQTHFFEKLIADRDRIYNDRSKAKHKYDEECMEVESHRHKQDRANDDKHAGRAAKQLEQQKIDMLNGKNTYLIAVAIANKAKSKFYEQDLPLLENQFQSIQAHLITSLTTLLMHSQSLYSTHIASLQSHSASVATAISQIDTLKDQGLFVEYNRDTLPFKVPEDWKFEPCEGFYDTGDMSVDMAPKVILQNKLGKCRTKLSELGPVLEAKQHEVEKLERLVSAYTQDRTLGDLDEIRENHLEAQRQLTYHLTSRSVLDAEIETISAALGGDEGAQRPHSFKSTSFSIPAQCGYCKTSIWGLSKQGKTCRVCHLSVHTRCELKLPAECSGGKSHLHSSASLSSTSITSSHISHESQAEPPSASSFARAHDVVSPEDYPHATVLFTFSASSPFELSVSAGESVQVLEDDDGSGWVKISDSKGGKGLVPASYIEHRYGDVETASPMTMEASSQGSGKYVRAIYAYEAGGDDELSLHEGARIELSAGLQGGQYYADGWWEGFDESGRKGIFPSTYVELA